MNWRRRARPRRAWSLVALGFALIIAAASWVQERTVREAWAYAGLPHTTSWHPGNWTRVLRNRAYLVGYSELRRNPRWVTYRLVHRPGQSLRGGRSEFRSDWRSLWRVSSGDYSHSGYDRGHLAPNHAIGLVYGSDAQRETFLMTNISPQRPKLNQKLWQRLEEVATDEFLPRFGELWVMTGPVFARASTRLPSGVEVPEAFYKIFIASSARGKLLALAFVMPQTAQGREPLDRFLVTIDEIERRTDLDFFPKLEDREEARIESGIAPEPWALSKVARRPPRY